MAPSKSLRCFDLILRPERWPSKRAFSFILAVDYFGPVANRGDTVYVSHAHRVRQTGGDYIMSTGHGAATRYAIVHVQGSSPTTWRALTYGWNAEGTSFGKTRVRLSRSKWRPAYRVRAVTYAGARP